MLSEKQEKFTRSQIWGGMMILLINLVPRPHPRGGKRVWWLLAKDWSNWRPRRNLCVPSDQPNQENALSHQTLFPPRGWGLVWGQDYLLTRKKLYNVHTIHMYIIHVQLMQCCTTNFVWGCLGSPKLVFPLSHYHWGFCPGSWLLIYQLFMQFGSIQG